MRHHTYSKGPLITVGEVHDLAAHVVPESTAALYGNLSRTLPRRHSSECLSAIVTHAFTSAVDVDQWLGIDEGNLPSRMHGPDVDAVLEGLTIPGTQPLGVDRVPLLILLEGNNANAVRGGRVRIPDIQNLAQKLGAEDAPNVPLCRHDLQIQEVLEVLPVPAAETSGVHRMPSCSPVVCNDSYSVGGLRILISHIDNCAHELLC
mmetsp:Transcript_65923/g.143587  ORF Transcript_65923/g.143587 Transcript_65923/m.143587 type:complete len:205 (-) Transcript_65923:130-744(-)